MVRWKIAVPFVVLSLAVTACGDSDDDDKDEKASDEPTMSAAEQKACDALQQIPQVFFRVGPNDPSEEDTLELQGLYADVAAGTTGEAQAAAQSVVDTVQEAIDTENMKLLDSDEFFGQTLVPLGAGVDTCGYEPLDIMTHEEPAAMKGENPEFKYMGVPDELDDGTYAVRLENKAKNFHEVIVVRLADDYEGTLEEFKMLPDEEMMKVVASGGVTFAPPMSTSVLSVELTEGRYVFFCHIPLMGKNGKPVMGQMGPIWHYNLGMANEVIVD